MPPAAALLMDSHDIDESLEANHQESAPFNTESYDRIYENPFLEVRQNPLSTFSIDVDTASYANLRRFLNAGSLPPKDAVRIEEMLNYFTYQYGPPADDRPFAVHAEVAACPWHGKHRLLRIALKGREIDLENRPASNLVLLIDVSGSMDDPAKLPLLKNALRLMIDKLGENDRVAMVVYAGSSGLVLPSTSGQFKETILSALDRLQAGGSTNGASGIQLAYQTARQNLIAGGTNRVILATDGDFNVGLTDQGALIRLIEEEAKSGIFLSVLGFGAGNLKDSTMEKLADRGNGNYAYIDSIHEARKVLVEQLGGTLVTIAKDVKLQLEFNPRRVAAYRLIGYENRLLRSEDFNDDAKDAGEIGAGHTVTALYELAPAGEDAGVPAVDELKYQRTIEPSEAAASDELLTLKLRYKEPDGQQSKLISTVVHPSDQSFAQASEDFRFASAVAGFGLVLRGSPHRGELTLAAVHELAAASRGADEHGYRAEFLGLVKQAERLSQK
ncbi:MAG TPA: VWA domain-containing protein [Pirellulales bacterium]|nr:VWA domain-containing protein [Pirellulales bacterium]